MTKYEELQNKIASSEIYLIETESTRQPAKTMRDEDVYAIFFNEKAFRDDGERYEQLVHEKGHCDSGALYNINTPLMTKEWCEHKAWRRAVVDNLPFDELLQAFENVRTADGVMLCDVAEHLGVPESFIERALEHYEKMGKQIISGDDW